MVLSSLPQVVIGTLEQAPKFLHNNEYIKTGYVINCNSFKNALKCLIKFNNETINTWTHLLGSIFFIFLIFYTIFYFTYFTIQLNIIKQDNLPSLEQKAALLYELSPPMNQLYESVKNIKKSFIHYNQKKIYNETFNNIFSLNNELYKYNISSFEYLNSFLDSLSKMKKETINLIKLDKFKTNELESSLDFEIRLKLKERSKKGLTKFPLFIILICAFLCLSFSTTYHVFKIISPIIYNILHKFDHGGISILITGS